LGVGKTINPEQDKVEEIENLFQNDKLKLAEYNIMDCVLVSEIFSKARILDYYIYFTQITGVLIAKQNLNNFIFKNLYTPYLHRANYSSPLYNKSERKGHYLLDEKISTNKAYNNVLEINMDNFILDICKALDLDPLNIAYNTEEKILPQILNRLDDYKKMNISDKALSLVSDDIQNILVKQLYSFNSLFFDGRIVKVIADYIKKSLDAINQYLENNNKVLIYGNHRTLYIGNVKKKR